MKRALWKPYVVHRNQRSQGKYSAGAEVAETVLVQARLSHWQWQVERSGGDVWWGSHNLERRGAGSAAGGAQWIAHDDSGWGLMI